MKIESGIPSSGTCAARACCGAVIAIGIALLAGCGGSSGDAPVADAAASAASSTASNNPPLLANGLPEINDSGFAATVSLAGAIDRSGPFFQSLGSNGRSCSTCHVQGEGWTITPAGLQERFASTSGTDPIFRTVDGSNSPNANVSTLDARRSAYGMLLSKGLIRVGMAVPANAEFELAAADDPYGYASATELSLFRRPLPTANLKFLSTVMWDGRETFKDPTSAACTPNTTTCFATIHFDLADQSNTATTNHAQATAPLTDSQRAAIVAFESDLYFAQIFDWQAGSLTANGALGGPTALSGMDFHFGINDTLTGDYQTRAPFTAAVMTLYDAWVGPPGSTVDEGGANSRQRAVARGQALFNSKPIQIRGVKGLNDDLKIDTIAGTCTTCHNTPNAGDHSVPLPLDIGIADASRRTPDMPLYTLRNKATGETTQTTDPGRALITGKWNDIGRLKGPVLRGLAARAPYFHNGMAKDLATAIDFYDTRFGIGFTADEKADLITFLGTL